MKVIVYSTPTWPWCHKVKDYLKSKNIAFQDVDVSSDHSAAMEMIDKSHQRGVPVIDINGSLVIGFDKEAIDHLLEQWWKL